MCLVSGVCINNPHVTLKMYDVIYVPNKISNAVYRQSKPFDVAEWLGFLSHIWGVLKTGYPNRDFS